eukprot:1184268-Prorocentrum_minimum.AAC.2
MACRCEHGRSYEYDSLLDASAYDGVFLKESMGRGAGRWGGTDRTASSGRWPFCKRASMSLRSSSAL